MSSTVDMGMISEVIDVLRLALVEPQKENARLFIGWCLNQWITPENLQEAIETDLDIITLSLNHLGLGHSLISPLLRLVFKRHWTEVEDMLTEPQNVYDIVVSKPGCREILATPTGIDYMNRCCESAYSDIYTFVWG